MEPDWLDPRYLDFDWPCFIHSGNSEHMARVDFEDYLYFQQWQWRYKPSRNGGAGALFRTVKVRQGEAGPWISKNEWLHVAVVVRQNIEPPTAEHTIVDHADSDHMNCTLANLRWATPSQNAFNRKGRCKDGFEAAVYSRERDAKRKGRARARPSV